MARFVLILLGACRCGAGEPDAPVDPPLAGACEASALLADGDRLLVADNETKDHLFAYDTSFTLVDRPALGASVDDIEALAAGPAGWWVVGSQGRKKSGEADPGRARVTLVPGGAVGIPDLSGCAPCVAAAPLAPERGGVNVEGAFVFGDHLWLGLRSPIVAGKALLLETDVPAAGHVKPTPHVVRVVPVDLGGFGVRDVTPAAAGGFYVVAGPADGAALPHRLYRLASPDAPPSRVAVDLPPSAEGIVDDGHGSLLFVTDGDGKKERCAEPSTWGRRALP